MPRLHFVIVAGMLLLMGRMCLSQVPAAPPARGLSHWAIVTAEEARGSGLSDLLTVKLSRLPEIELVEREKIDATLKELELSVLFSEEKTADRLRFGQLVGADALLLLSLEGSDKERRIHAVAVDCRYGARLGQTWIASKIAELEKDAAGLVTFVKDIRARFPRGIEAMIGIPDFISRNFEHHWDHLQDGLPRLVRESLSTYPGVAVMEFDRAVAILEELELTAEQTDAVLPVFVEGEYEVLARPAAADDAGSESRAGDENPPVRLTLRIRRSGAAQTFGCDGMLLDELSRRLSTRVPVTIMQVARLGRGKSIPPERLLELLLERVDQFAALGMWQEAAEVREAALLIEPDNMLGHLQALCLHRRAIVHMRPRNPSAQDTSPHDGPRPLTDDEARLFRWWRTVMVHARILIRREFLSLREAFWLINDVYLANVYDVSNHYGVPLDRILPERNRFLWQVAPVLPRLEEKGNATEFREFEKCPGWGRGYYRDRCEDPGYLHYCWMHHLNQFVFLDTAGNGQLGMRLEIKVPPEEADELFDQLYRLYTEIFPKDMPPLPRDHSIRMLGRHLEYLCKYEHVGQEQARSFCRRLAASESRAARFAAADTLWCLDNSFDKTSLENMKTLIVAMDEWIDSVGEVTGHDIGNVLQALRSEYRDKIAYIEKTEAARAAKEAALAAGKTTVNPNHPIVLRPGAEPGKSLVSGIGYRTAPTDTWLKDAEHKITLKTTSDVFDVFGGVTYELVCEFDDAERIRTILPLTDSADLVHVERLGLCLMREPGRLEHFLPGGESQEGSVLCVEHCREEGVFWIVAGTGIYAVTEDKQVLGKFDESTGLPSERRSVKLCPLGPKRCLAAGNQGDHGRAWIAMLSISEDGVAQAETLLKTTHVPGSEGADALNVNFGPHYCKLVEKAGARPKVMVSRSGQIAPLWIDVETLAIAPMPNWNGRYAPKEDWRRGAEPTFGHVECPDGSILVDAKGKFYRCIPPEKKGGKWTRKLACQFPSLPAVRGRSVRHPLGLHCHVFRQRDKAWCVNSRGIIEIDLNTWKPRVVTAGGVPDFPADLQSSVHFGLVLCDGKKLWRVVLDAEKPSEEHLQRMQRAVKIPDDKIAAHIRAVDGLYRAGIRPGWSGFRSSTQRTVVTLWNHSLMTPEALQLIGGLYGRKTVQAVCCPFNDAALKTLSGVPGIEQLELISTQITPAGLKLLADMPDLRRFRLFGKDVDAAMLDALPPLPYIQMITLYGPTLTEPDIVRMKERMPHGARVDWYVP